MFQVDQKKTHSTGKIFRWLQVFLSLMIHAFLVNDNYTAVYIWATHLVISFQCPPCSCLVVSLSRFGMHVTTLARTLGQPTIRV